MLSIVIFEQWHLSAVEERALGALRIRSCSDRVPIVF